MKNIFFAALVFALALPAAVFAQGNKVGTIDMDRIFKEHPKTKEAEIRFNRTKEDAKKEFEEKADAYKKALDDINKLKLQLDAPTLSVDAKTAKAKERDDKIAGIQTMERDINQFRQTREQQFQQEVQKVRDEILKEITDIVMERVKAKDLDYVFDKSGGSMNGLSPILYSREDYEFTGEVIAALGKGSRATSTSPSPAKATSTPAASPRRQSHRALRPLVPGEKAVRLERPAGVGPESVPGVKGGELRRLF